MTSALTTGGTGSGLTGVNLQSHIDGSDPASRKLAGVVSVGHTWAIPIGALVLLWLFGTVVFRGLGQ